MLKHQKMVNLGAMLTRKSGFNNLPTCAYHPAAPGSSPKHAIYAFSFIVFVLYLSCEKNENKQKEAGFGPLKKKTYLPLSMLRL